jgi:hypothetical protein
MNISDRAATLLATVRQHEEALRGSLAQLTANAAALNRAAIEIERSSSGSNFGYHGELYYGDFQRPPIDERFNVEWGGIDGIPPRWNARTKEEVKQRIESLSGIDATKVMADSVRIINSAKQLREEIVIGLSPIHEEVGLAKEKALFDDIESLDWAESKYSEYCIVAMNAFPKITRDSEAYAQGMILPQHTYYKVVAKQIEASCESIEEFWRLSHRLLRLLEMRKGRDSKGASEPISKPLSSSVSSTWEKIAAVLLGLIFVIVLLVTAMAVPNPSYFQLFVFRIVLALAAAGIAAIVPGLINFESKTPLYAIRGGGALAVFLLVYLVNPPALLHSDNRAAIPGDAAWLIGGRLRLDRQTGQHIERGGQVVWASGPDFVVVETADKGSREIPLTGDTVKLLKSRLLYIVDYKTAGITKSNVEPPEKGKLDYSDETGVWLPAGTVLDVRKVAEGSYLGEDESFLWLRVGYPAQ